MLYLLLVLCVCLASFCGILRVNDYTAPEKSIVILLGPPGSGKGTQAVQISRELQIPHISTGDLFRENISKNTPLGQKAKGFISQGKLVPDELVLDMLFDRVSKPDGVKGYLLDGFPRTIPQAEAFQKHSRGANLIVLNLNVGDETIIKRISGRLTCKNCNTVYNKYFSPTKSNDKCDKCNGELMQRPDDRPEVVMERLKIYNEQTKPLISFYEMEPNFHNIQGDKALDQVFQDMMLAIRK